MTATGFDFEENGFVLQSCELNGSILSYWEAGEGPLALLIHGFPDTPETFEYQFPRLLDAGYRVVAPYLPGYFPSRARLEVGNYHPIRLGEDFVALIDHLGYDKATLIGHDWGALAANMVASIAPEKVDQMVVAAVPHFNAFMAKRIDFRQMWRSRYALFFQTGRLAHHFMKRKNLSGINYLWNYWSPGWRYSETQINTVKDCLKESDGLWNSMGYYRAIVQQSSDKDLMDVLGKPLETSTLVFAGMDDGCIALEIFTRPHDGYRNGRLVEVPNAGHFMHRENSAFFNQVLLQFLQRDS